MRDQDEHLNRFREQWRDWAEKPPRRSPAQAAQRFRATVRAARQRHTAWWLGRWALAGAFSVLLLVAAAAGLRSLRTAISVPTHTQAAVLEAPALGAGQVLIWLDEETPLYMTFQVPDEIAENGGSS